VQNLEFFKLAAVMLQCMWYEINVKEDPVFNLIGSLDYSSEMYFVIEQEKARINERAHINQRGE